MAVTRQNEPDDAPHLLFVKNLKLHTSTRAMGRFKSIPAPSRPTCSLGTIFGNTLADADTDVPITCKNTPANLTLNTLSV
jgi:hypothetical protein